MIHYTNYVMAESLDEAYELNKKKSAVICGGFCWLRLQNRTVQTLIDLSGLGLDRIEETEEQFEIGCMASLMSMETHEGFNRFTGGAAADSVRPIVGVQFRNCATVGGSIYGRFGFSDVLTLFLALGARVKLYKGGILPLEEFLDRKEDGDILVSVLVDKGPAAAACESMRNEAADFPILTVAACRRGDRLSVAVGARPAKAQVRTAEASCFSEGEKREKAAEELISSFSFGTNMRASAEYRRYLAGVLLDRCLKRCLDRPAAPADGESGKAFGTVGAEHENGQRGGEKRWN